MADDAERGHPSADEPSVPATSTPTAVPDMEVFADVTSLAASLVPSDPDGFHESPAPVEDGPEVPIGPSRAEVPASDAVTDEERNRYGLLLDRAAERGLLEPSEYEVRLRELAEAATIEQMNQIVTELPVFNAPPPNSASRKSRSAGRPMHRTTGDPGQRRRGTVWALMALLVVIAVVSLVILAISAERLTHRQDPGSGTAPVATRTVSGLRL